LKIQTESQKYATKQVPNGTPESSFDPFELTPLRFKVNKRVIDNEKRLKAFILLINLRIQIKYITITYTFIIFLFILNITVCENFIKKYKNTK